MAGSMVRGASSSFCQALGVVRVRVLGAERSYAPFCACFVGLSGWMGVLYASNIPKPYPNIAAYNNLLG